MSRLEHAIESNKNTKAVEGHKNSTISHADSKSLLDAMNHQSSRENDQNIKNGFYNQLQIDGGPTKNSGGAHTDENAGRPRTAEKPPVTLPNSSGTDTPQMRTDGKDKADWIDLEPLRMWSQRGGK